MSVIEKARTQSLGSALRVGVVGGIAGSLAMAMYAMVVSGSVKHTGFFTPLYHIASALISPNAMMTSMTDAMHGNSAYFVLAPALVGAMIHMMTGAMAGAVFGVVMSKVAATRSLTLVYGAGFGLVVLIMNAFIGLPIIAHLFGGGQPISQMAKVVGWGHFSVEHLLFGLGLGFVVSRSSVNSND
ncbi:MAG TPA: hypothetical protein VMV52_08085 [Candidatus Nanopelagicaceae bacterium]|nr:hypothetical protein [Candidatus Nanopelagicaceae bacterium]